jgi:hypothetical protein
LILLTEPASASRFNSELKEILEDITRNGNLYYSVSGHRSNSVSVSRGEGHTEICSFRIGAGGELKGIYSTLDGRGVIKCLQRKYSGKVDIRKF